MKTLNLKGSIEVDGTQPELKGAFLLNEKLLEESKTKTVALLGKKSRLLDFLLTLIQTEQYQFLGFLAAVGIMKYADSPYIAFKSIRNQDKEKKNIKGEVSFDTTVKIDITKASIGEIFQLDKDTYTEPIVKALVENRQFSGAILDLFTENRLSHILFLAGLGVTKHHE